MEGTNNIIFLVDDNETDLAAGVAILKEKYTVYPIMEAQNLFNLLGHVRPAMILLDIVMPGMDGYGVIQKLKENPEWQDIPVIFLTAISDECNELDCLSLGAIDYIPKPFSGPVLLQRMEKFFSN